MRKISILLVVTMLCSMIQFMGNLAYADTPCSGIILTSDLNDGVDIIIGPDDKLYVSDYSGNKIVKMDKDGSNITTVTTDVVNPEGMAFDNDGNLIVAEYYRGRVAKVDSGGNTTYSEDNLDYVAGVAVDSHNKIFVMGKSTGNIYKMDADGSNSTVFVTVKKDSSAIENSLQGLGIDSNDNLYVSDLINGRIIKIDPSSVQSDFATVSAPRWVSVGEDGYVYASSGNGINGTIEKFDLSGNKIETYSTGSYYPWGTQVDASGVIYFVHNGANAIKILSYADTVDRTHVKIKLVYDLVSGPADASAFALSGVSSNPQVTSAVVNGSEIDLTLDSNIESTDEAVKVSYTKTGTHNLVQQGTNIEVGGFSDLPVTNHIVGVSSVETLSNINVDNGTQLSAVGLPETVVVNLVQSTPSTTSAAVTWDGGTPTYDGNVAGTYTFSGTLILGNNISNPEGTKASVNVVVEENPHVTTTSDIDEITVPNGTVLSSVELPTKVSFSLSNSTTTSAAVVWDGGTPTYDGQTAGTYVFLGTLASSNKYINPNNVKASVNVVVSAQVLPTITTANTINTITVPNGTVFSSVELPTKVSFSLSNSKTTSAAVVWDGGTPTYDGQTAGTYVFSGMLASSNEYINPNNVKASVSVVVQPVQSPRDRDNSSGGGSISSSGVTEDNGIVEVNGVSQKAAKEVRTTENGRSKVKVTIDSASLKKVMADLLEKAPSSETTLRNLATINVQDTGADSTVVDLDGEIVKQMDQNKFDILVNVGDKAYKIPAEELAVDSIANRLVVAQDDLKSINYYIQVDKITAEQQSEITKNAVPNNGKVIIEPTEFKVSVVVTRNDGTTEVVEMDSFKQYVKRVFKIPKGTNLSDVTTGAVFDQDYNYNQVPTRLYTENGINYAEVNSLTNSIYSIISNPIAVNSVKGHWSESIVNDMASRLILTDYDQFRADKNVTRGEFATYMTRALGLYTSDANFESSFTDVKKTDDNVKGIVSAVRWGLVSGYEDGTFKPDNEITREEAMVLFAKAMEITNYEGVIGSSSFDIESGASISVWSKSYIQKVLDGKIFVGRSNHDLGLKENITHAETLAALRNLLVKSELINK